MIAKHLPQTMLISNLKVTSAISFIPLLVWFQKAYPEMYASRVSSSGWTIIRDHTRSHQAELYPTSPHIGHFIVQLKQCATTLIIRGIKLSKGRTLSKLASNHYSSDCLAPSVEMTVTCTHTYIIYHQLCIFHNYYDCVFYTTLSMMVFVQ